MSFQLEQWCLLNTEGVPHQHLSILAPGYQEGNELLFFPCSLILQPLTQLPFIVIDLRQASNFCGVPDQGLEECSLADVPDLYRLVG